MTRLPAKGAVNHLDGLANEGPRECVGNRLGLGHCAFDNQDLDLTVSKACRFDMSPPGQDRKLQISGMPA